MSNLTIYCVFVAPIFLIIAGVLFYKKKTNEAFYTLLGMLVIFFIVALSGEKKNEDWDRMPRPIEKDTNFRQIIEKEKKEEKKEEKVDTTIKKTPR